MTVFKNNVKRILRNKLQFFFIVLFPLLFMQIAFIDDEPIFQINMAIIDQDQSELTAAMISYLESKANIIPIEESRIEEELMSLKLDYAVIVPHGFTRAILAGESGGMTGYSVMESDYSLPISSFMEQWIEHARLIAGAVNHDPVLFYDEFTSYDQQGPVQLKYHAIADLGQSRTSEVIGLVIAAIMYTSLIVSLFILINRNNHTLHRTMAAPMTIKNYMLQTICSFLFVSWIQITIVMILLKWGYGMYLGGSGMAIYFMLLLFSLVSVSIGVAMSSLSKNMIQACLIGMCIIPQILMLGGAYFPLDGMPELIISISKFVPVSWMMDGIMMLLQGEGLGSLGKEISILLVFAVIFFLLGTLRKIDIAK